MPRDSSRAILLTTSVTQQRLVSVMAFITNGTETDLFREIWWRHQMETFSTLLATCAGNSPVTGEFPTQRPVTRSFDVFFDMRLNKRLNEQWQGWRFEMPLLQLWRHSNEQYQYRGCWNAGSLSHCFINTHDNWYVRHTHKETFVQ